MEHMCRKIVRECVASQPEAIYARWRPLLGSPHPGAEGWTRREGMTAGPVRWSPVQVSASGEEVRK